MYKTYFPKKLLPQFDRTTCLEMFKRLVLTNKVKPFLAGKLCQLNFQIFSSLTIVSLIVDLTFKCLDSNRGDVNFNSNKVTYFHKDYYLPSTDFHLLVAVHGVD